VTAPLFALVLAGVAPVWVATRGFDGPGCNAEAFAAALHAQRPGTPVHPWHPEAGEHPPDGVLSAELLREGGGAVTLKVTGLGRAIARSLPAADICERNVATAALIVDGALDDLETGKKAPTVDSLAPPLPFLQQLHLSVEAGGGVMQGVFALVPAFAVGGSVRYRYWELTLDGSFGLASQEAFSVVAPEQQGGTLAAHAFAAELGTGFTPRLGPGRFAADLVLGLSFTSASPSATSSTPGEIQTGLFQQTTPIATEPFGALRITRSPSRHLPRGPRGRATLPARQLPGRWLHF